MDGANLLSQYKSTTYVMTVLVISDLGVVRRRLKSLFEIDASQVLRQLAGSLRTSNASACLGGCRESAKIRPEIAHKSKSNNK